MQPPLPKPIGESIRQVASHTSITPPCTPKPDPAVPPYLPQIPHRPQRPPRQFIRRLEDEHGRCDVSRRFVSFGVYDPSVIPFIKPGYVEIGVPRARRRCPPGGNQSEAAAPTAARGAGAGGWADDVPGGEDDACAMCGECADDGREPEAAAV